jgi:hypothetical protein
MGVDMHHILEVAILVGCTAAECTLNSSVERETVEQLWDCWVICPCMFWLEFGPNGCAFRAY